MSECEPVVKIKNSSSYMDASVCHVGSIRGKTSLLSGAVSPAAAQPERVPQAVGQPLVTLVGRITAQQGRQLLCIFLTAKKKRHTAARAACMN
eukprot:1159974-Pelagomonas_calceolata.AAC.5